MNNYTSVFGCGLMDGFENVTLAKFPELDEVDSGLFKTALSHFFKKVGEDAKLHLTVKEYKKGGLKAQHEVHAKLMFDGKEFFAEYTDWQLLGTVQQVLKKLEKEVSKDSSKRE